MKTYEQLSEGQKKKAVNYFLTQLLQGICDGVFRFNDELNQNDLQSRIDKAFEKAEKMQTPWFAHEYIMDTCKDELEGMAMGDAEGVNYLEANDALTVPISLIDKS